MANTHHFWAKKHYFNSRAYLQLIIWVNKLRKKSPLLSKMLWQKPSSAHISGKCHLPSQYFAASTGQQNPPARSFLISQHVLQKPRNYLSECKSDPRKCQSTLSSFYSHSWCYWQGRCLCFSSNFSKSLPAVHLMTCKAVIRQWHTYKPLLLMTGAVLHHHHPI